MTLEEVHLPVIDISGASLESAKRLLDACTEHGFVFVELESTNITEKDVDYMFDLNNENIVIAIYMNPMLSCADSGTNSQRNSLPRPAKKKRVVPLQKTWVLYKSYQGNFFTTAEQESLYRIGVGVQCTQKFWILSTRGCLNIGEFSHGKMQQTIPPSLEKDETDLSNFFDYCHELCNRLLELFAMALQIQEKDGGKQWFTSRHDPSKGPSGSILRLLHYPALPEGADYIPEQDIRAGAHSDYGSVTLLFQRPGQEGLEILTKSWTAVPVYPSSVSRDRPPPVLVNVGDLLSYWTGGLLRSTVHRVIFPKKARLGGEDRYSMAFFCHPVNSALLEPVPSEIVKSQAKKRGAQAEEHGKTMTALEHLQKRLAATYGWKK